MIIQLDYENDAADAKEAILRFIADFRAGEKLHFAVFCPESEHPEIISLGINDLIKFDKV